MPHRCCVATCKGNYNTGPKVAVFSFPRDYELRAKWIKKLRRKDKFEPTKHSRVCELHFHPEEIEREVEIFDDKSGNIVKAPLSYPRLKRGSVPSKLPEGPQYLSSNSSTRLSPNKKKIKLESDNIKKAIEASILTKEAHEKATTFNSLLGLKLCLEQEHLPSGWSVVHSSENVMFLYIKCSPAPVIESSITIDNHLQCSTYLKHLVIDKLGQYTFPYKMCNINDLIGLLNKIGNLKSSSTKDDVVTDHLQLLNDILLKVRNILTEKSSEIDFLLEQLNRLNLSNQNHQYSSNFIVFCSLLFTISPHSYRFLRNSGNFAMPHPRTINRVCGKMSVNPAKEQLDSNFLCYIKQQFAALQITDKCITLMVDEVHLKSCFDFKGGNICGMAFNSDNAASSAYVFMIRSLKSSYQDVAYILPTKTLAAEDLYHYLNKVVVGLENIGFNVVAVVTDNNSINKKAMTFFADKPQVSIVYKNPADPKKALFFVIDSVHILKCVRNNWLNQKTFNQCIIYPNFENFSSLETASFNDIKKLHKIECDKIVKYSYGLSLKALFPNSLERQNVKLALQIFNLNVAEALKVLDENQSMVCSSGTSQFIKIIHSWWSILNVKTLFKGQQKNDEFQTPLTTKQNDVKYEFLNKFICWLEEWKNKGCSSGGLSKETHFALLHTTYAIIEMTRYCIEELNFEYILPGKVQTDPLENRFGKYRQLAGSQHNISIRQVYETESKLRLQNTLPTLIKSIKYGNIPIFLHNEEDTLTETNLEEENISKFLDKITVDEDDFKNIEKDLPILTYIAGYCSYKISRRLKCEICKTSLTIDKQLTIEDANLFWIRTFDRGLSYPHPDVLNAIIYCFIIIKKLVSPEMERYFLCSLNQLEIATCLTLETLKEDSYFLDLDKCEKHDEEKVLKLIVTSAANTFLNNYCKKKNEGIQSTKNISKVRKLKTFNKN